MDFQSLGRLLIIGGITLAIVGAVLLFLGRVFPALGNLPGDIRIQNENFSCFAPIATMILLSIILTVVLNIIVRLINR